MRMFELADSLAENDVYARYQSTMDTEPDLSANASRFQAVAVKNGVQTNE